MNNHAELPRIVSTLIGASPESICRRAAEHRAVVCDGALKQTTLAAWQSKIAALEDVLAHIGAVRMTEDLFTIIIGELHKADRSLSLASKYQAAVLHWQLSRRWGLGPGEEAWASRVTNPTLKKMFQGFNFKQGEEPSEPERMRGAIGLAELALTEAWIGQRLLQDPNDIRARADHLMIPGARVAIQAALRRSEIRSARCCDWDPGSQTLTVRVNKCFNANSMAHGVTSSYEKWIAITEAATFFTERKHNAAATEFLLCPKLYKFDNLADLFKRAAKEVPGFPQTLCFCGHSMRHGGVAEILNQLKNVSTAISQAAVAAVHAELPNAPACVVAKVAASAAAAAQEVTERSATGQCTAVRQHYCRSNAVRVAELRVVIAKKRSANPPAKTRRSCPICHTPTNSDGCCLAAACPGVS